MVPDEEGQQALMRVIYDGVKADADPQSYRKDMEMVVRSLRQRGAEYFVLACTELPLAFDALRLPVTTVDPTLVLARAAIRYCGYQTNDLLEMPKIRL
jgi:aspartate racemase